METSIYVKHIDEIKKMISRLGIDGTDDYLISNLSTFSKKVAALREEIHRINDSMDKENNSDEIIHFKCELEDKEELLTELLTKLMTADSMYLCYKEYIRKE